MQANIPDERYVADALWLDRFDLKDIPADIAQKITSTKHGAASYGKRMRDYLQWLQDHPQSNNPNYNKRYQALREAVDELTPQQAYILRTSSLGKNMSEGFEEIPAKANLQFPRDHQVKLRSQVGWHFFVGSVWAEDGQEYGVELMFFRIALLPPTLAAKAGLSNEENQIIEMQLGLSKAGDVHHQAKPVVVAGTSGLFSCSSDDQPFAYKLGRNQIISTKKDSFFPLRLQARGVDRGAKTPFELGIDLEVTSDRAILYQGQDGCMPSIAGFGTLYYSIPQLTLKAGSTITYGGKQVKLKKGLLWFDHQWGFMGGNSRSAALRASINISGTPAPSGWDWFMQQFDGNRQITVFAPHSNKDKQFYFQTGPTPPGAMTVSVAGKYMDPENKLHNIWGTLTIDGWARATASPDPSMYPVTDVWHPNRWNFTFDETVPQDIREFSMQQIVPAAQTNYFANCAQYNEGAVYVIDPAGEKIGRGFAEAVAYANTDQNAYRLLGIDKNTELIGLLQQQTASLPRRLGSFVYMLAHQQELKHVLQTAAGLEFLGPKPKTAASRH